RTDHLLRHDTVSGSMRSYSEWVPMNFTRTRPNANDTWTINRYLFPPRSNMARLSPTKSTVPPNCRLISAGLRQCALAAMANHARIGPSACGRRAQNSVSVRRAITCMATSYHVPNLGTIRTTDADDHARPSGDLSSPAAGGRCGTHRTRNADRNKMAL